MMPPAPGPACVPTTGPSAPWFVSPCQNGRTTAASCCPRGLVAADNRQRLQRHQLGDELADALERLTARADTLKLDNLAIAHLQQRLHLEQRSRECRRPADAPTPTQELQRVERSVEMDAREDTRRARLELIETCAIARLLRQHLRGQAKRRADRAGIHDFNRDVLLLGDHLCRLDRRAVGRAQLRAETELQDAGRAAPDHVLVRLLERADGGRGGRRRDRAGGELLVELVGREVDAIAVRLVAEQHQQRDDGDIQTARAFLGNVGCAIDGDHHCHTWAPLRFPTGATSAQFNGATSPRHRQITCATLHVIPPR